MNDGIRSSGLVCISTTTFSDVDIFLYAKCLRFAPQTGELLQNSYFFAKNKKQFTCTKQTTTCFVMQKFIV